MTSTDSPSDSEKNTLRDISRFSAWALLICVIMLLVSGWGITQTGVIYKITFGLVDRRAADSIHRAMNVPLAFFFLSHVLINIRQAIHGKNSTGKWVTDGIFIILALLILSAVIFLEYFRRGG
jgi:hypothetical protein